MTVRNGLSNDHANWLETRGIPSDLAKEMGLVSKGTAIGFPYRNADGAVRFTKWRGPNKSFWIEPTDQKLEPWLLHLAIKEPSDTLIWTEGEIDALSLLTAGASTVVSVPNGAQQKPGTGDIDPTQDAAFGYLWRDGKLRPEISRFKRHILALDNDGPGQVLRDELAIRLGRQVCWHVTYPPGCKDANDVLRQHGPERLMSIIETARPMVPNQLVKFSELSRSSNVSLSSGWQDLDEHLMISIPEVLVISGPPNHGEVTVRPGSLCQSGPHARHARCYHPI